MASTNADSMNNAQGEFKPSVPSSEPLTTKGHQPGLKTDSHPEFSAETHAPGTAPAANTFHPNPESEIPGQADNASIPDELRTDASDTLGGATSADAHTGLGHPGQGQSSAEQHSATKTKGSGIEQLGTAPKGLDAEMRRLGEDKGSGSEGPKAAKVYRGENVSLEGAEAKEGVRAEELAGQRP